MEVEVLLLLLWVWVSPGSGRGGEGRPRVDASADHGSQRGSDHFQERVASVNPVPV